MNEINSYCRPIASSEIYRSVPIHPAEARKVLGWADYVYRRRLLCGKIKRSIVVCDIRPNDFSFHSYWDVAEAKIISYFENQCSIWECDSAALEEAMDGIARVIEYKVDHGQYYGARPSLCASEFMEVCAAFSKIGREHAEQVKGIFSQVDDFLLSRLRGKY